MENKWEIGKSVKILSFFCVYNLRISHDLEKKHTTEKGWIYKTSRVQNRHIQTHIHIHKHFYTQTHQKIQIIHVFCIFKMLKIAFMRPRLDSKMKYSFKKNIFFYYVQWGEILS